MALLQVLQPRGRIEDLGPVCNVFISKYTAPAGEGGGGYLYGLVGLVTGAPARELAQLSERARMERVTRQYRDYFGSGAALRPALFLSKAWMHEPWTRGCYTGERVDDSNSGVGTICRPSHHGVRRRWRKRLLLVLLFVWRAGYVRPVQLAEPEGHEEGPQAGWAQRSAPPGVTFASTEMATRWIGYFEGALEAGERAAERAARALREAPAASAVAA